MLGLARTGPRREHRCCGFFELCQKHLIRCCWRPPDLWELDGGRECGVAYAICSFDIDSRSATSSAESTLFCSCSSMLLLTCLASVSALCGTLKPDRLEELLAREAGVELASLGVSGCIGSGVNAAHLTEGARRGPEPGSAAAAAWRGGVAAAGCGVPAADAAFKASLNAAGLRNAFGGATPDHATLARSCASDAFAAKGSHEPASRDQNTGRSRPGRVSHFGRPSRLAPSRP